VRQVSRAISPRRAAVTLRSWAGWVSSTTPPQGHAPDNLRYRARGDDVARTTNKGETR
jgi:hypothetical protein